ncbi:hypothetical protein [Blastococcus haudaquaticus]|uniref:Uncharacterized protein n=1 Tax=Blastococcus haudaquaticus TaxID=1938745 RepID=A0A286H0I4_9ACTN|nr:hypothetical protein [Blastococcus haudaquaticus]SOE01285.1 hypothetical protein SAMN06272739_3068 [Blastococcus haudaquaticus]
MTASLFVIGTDAPRSGAGHHVVFPGMAHAVARPVVDGLDASVCGVLVTAAAGADWSDDRDAPRCAECSRIAG